MFLLREGEAMKLKALICFATALWLGWQAEAQNYDTNSVLVETFAGSGATNYLNGQNIQAEFSNPSQIAADSFGNLFVLDAGNHRIRKITPDGTVSTFSGGGTGELEGYGTNVSLNYTFGSMTIDSSNTLWIVAYNLGVTYLLNITSDGYVSIENANLTGLFISSGICVDSSNNVYYYGSESGLLTPGIHTNIIFRYSPINDSVQPFAYVPFYQAQGTTGPQIIFAVDPANDIFVWNPSDCLIRKIDQNTNVTIFAGRPPNQQNPNINTNTDGIGTNAFFSGVSAMTMDNSGNVLLVCGPSIRKIDASTNVVTMAGNFIQSGYADGIGSNVLFSGASGVCVSQGTIFVADSNNERIRKILVNPMPISGANVTLNTYPGLTIPGILGRAYQIQSSPDMNTWTTVATVLLTSSPYLWIDQNPVSGNKFYRALLLP
jgi:NHL repeat